jgi:hypothetical protein
MSDWQPARFVQVHNWEGVDGRYEGPIKVGRGELVRARPCEKPSGDNLEAWRMAGCDSEKFFQVHPEDVDRLFPWRKGCQTGLCEHEILTD